MDANYDAIVIGSGQAGPFLAARLAEAGQAVALIERSHLGGTCVNEGCMPTKTLVASARAAHVARHAAHWGVQIPGPVTVDMHAVRARKEAVVAESVANLHRWLEHLPGLTLLWGHARFVGPCSVQVEEAVLHAPRIFINTGARPATPNWPGLEDTPFLTSTSILDLDELPEHLVILGGSYIALEFAQAYSRFGAQVTVVETAPRIVAREDEDVSTALHEMLDAEGVRIIVGASGGRVLAAPLEDGRGRWLLRLDAAGEAVELQASHLLVATGRRPNTDDLGLEHAGIVPDARGYIAVDDELRTTADGIWALGDVNGRGGFTHTSYNDFEIVAANLLDGESRKAGDRIPVYALFTDPPLARIGMDRQQARASGRPVLVGRMPMSRVGRARERGETHGHMQVLVDAQTERILGATLLGIEADEAIHVLLGVMAAGAPYHVLRRCMPIHPTVSELLPTLLGNLEPLA